MLTWIKYRPLVFGFGLIPVKAHVNICLVKHKDGQEQSFLTFSENIYLI